MTAMCFVCNLPILTHQVGLVWQGGNGWDDLTREQLEESTIRQRLLSGGRRDSAAQISAQSPPTSPPSGMQRRRRSSLAQLTDILREWSGGNSSKRNSKAPLNRRETLADLARGLPWARSTQDNNYIAFGTNTNNNNNNNNNAFPYRGTSVRKRRESSVDSGVRNVRSNVRAADLIMSTDFQKNMGYKENPPDREKDKNNNTDTTGTTDAGTTSDSRRGSGESGRSGRRGDLMNATTPPPKIVGMIKRRRNSLVVSEAPNFRQEQRPSTSSTDSSAMLFGGANQTDASCQILPPPTIVMSSVTPPATSPCTATPLSPAGAAPASAAVAPPTPAGRRDSTTQCPRFIRRDSRVSPERPRIQRLQRQATAFDESYLPPGGLHGNRRESQPTLSPDDDVGERRARRDSLSPDSATRGRRDSRTHLSPDRSHERGGGGGGSGSGGGGGEGNPRCRSKLRRQSSSAARQSRSPDSSSCCSSRDASPCGRPNISNDTPPTKPPVRRQSTTEEILISRGFRRQSTTDEMIRCRNFRRQSSQSDDTCSRYRGRRDSCAQITDGTIGTMTVETTSTFFDTSTQTEPSPLYDNNHYHEECLKCNSCSVNLTGPNQKRARRFKNQILCDLHFADVALMECSDFMQQLRSFKPQSLGCAVARRKSSTTLIFPLPPQACSDEFCEDFPHNLIATPGYWIECSRQKISMRNPLAQWDDSESENDDSYVRVNAGGGGGGGGGGGDGGGCGEMCGRNCTDPHFERGCSDLFEDDEDSEVVPSSRKKTVIEEQWELQNGFELTSVEQETYEKYFFATEHWNYFTNDEDLGPVILSIKQETCNGRDQFRILVRAISYTVHGLIPASCVFADRYNREEVVKSLGKEVNLHPPLILGQLPDTQDELLKLDQVFIKSELKVGVIYVKENQFNEEQILDNNENSILFDEFLQLIGDKCRLRGFDKYKGGLDTVHDLTGLYSVYTNWRGIEIMFHVSTLLPYEKHDAQKLQRKRHIGNDIVCVVFLEADNTPFCPACIKSHFLHTFILVRPLPSTSHLKLTFDTKQVRVSARIKRKPTRYEVSVVTRDEVGAYKPYLWEQSVFEKGPMFREWILTKIVNGERASYSAPKFARMQERTRSQMLEDIVANLANYVETGQIPKPYRRGSWRPIGHMRPSSPLLDSVRDQFEDYDQLAKDFTRVFLNEEPSCLQHAQLFDVVFLVGQSKQKARFIGVRAILGVRSRVFQEMLYGIQTGFGSQVPVAELLSRPAPTLMSPQNKTGRTKSSNFLQVPDLEAPRPKSVPSSPMVKRAFSRLGTITAGWGRSIRSRQQNNQLNVDDKKKWASSQDCSNKDIKDRDKEKQLLSGQLAVPRLSVCADAQKVDRTKLAQTEFIIIEFDPETFRALLDYLHTGSCPLTCISIPGLICAAEHYDLPELLQACFHHAKQYLRIEVVCSMLISLENYYWRYTSASELVNMILAYAETKAQSLFLTKDFLNLSESMVQMIMCRNLEIPEIRKFEAMLQWCTHKISQRVSAKIDAKFEFRCIMDRLTRDLKLHRITPTELIKIVLPSKAIKNERILETLMYQANSGMYRIHESYIQQCQERLQKQDSRYSEWGESFDC